MKSILLKIVILFSLTLCLSSYSQTGHKKSTKTKSYHSGTYKGGKGSSHKGGKYKNSSTGNHYRKRK
jgi:hypothetical protein